MRYFPHQFVLCQGSRYPDHLGVSQLLLTPCSEVLPDQLTVSQVVKKFLTVCGTRMFLTIFTSARHLSVILSHSNPVHFSHPTFIRLILILSFHLLLVLPSDIFLSGFRTKILYAPLLTQSVPHAPYISSFLFDHMNNIWCRFHIIMLLFM